MSGEVLIRANGVVPCNTAGVEQAPLDLEVGAGDLVALVGADSRALDAYLCILAGAAAPAVGEIEFPWYEQGGNTRLPVSAGYVSWRAPLVSAFSGVDNVKLPALYHRLDTEVNIAQRVQVLLAAMDYKADHSLLPAYMAPLQQAHLLVARALMLEPRVLCIDEPFHGLDLEARDRMAAYLVSLTGQGYGLVVSLDDPDFVAANATQVVCVGEGAVRRFDTWDELLDSHDPQIQAYLEPHRRDCRALKQDRV